MGCRLLRAPTWENQNLRITNRFDWKVDQLASYSIVESFGLGLQNDSHSSFLTLFMLRSFQYFITQSKRRNISSATTNCHRLEFSFRRGVMLSSVVISSSRGIIAHTWKIRSHQGFLVLCRNTTTAIDLPHTARPKILAEALAPTQAFHEILPESRCKPGLGR